MTTKISWADESWNMIIGCSKTSAGCQNCYAERMAHRQAHMEMKRGAPERYGNVLKCNGKWSGETVFIESALTKPLHWRNPCKIFVVSMGDLFHESVPFEWIDRVFAVMALCPQHEFKVLTKRAGRMREYLCWQSEKPDMINRRHRGQKIDGAGPIENHICGFTQGQWPLLNVHLGVTVENQENVGRIADLIQTPAAKRFISFEPLLEYVDFNQDLFDGKNWCGLIDYAFIGCESGPKARICGITDIRRQIKLCRESEIAVHVKQIPLNGKCNKNIGEWPEEFQVREI